jgi:hypothetical protein
MEDNTIKYSTMTKIQLVSLCKERNIRGYAQTGITKETIIKLLKGEVEYKDPRQLENWSDNKKESFKKALKKRQLKNNLFDYLTKNNPSIIIKYAGNQDELKLVSHSTMVHYKWNCKNLDCSNVFEARPRDVFRNDSKSPTIYCSECKYQERGITYQKNMLNKNGSIQEKIPKITNVWCEDNKFKPDKLTAHSHKKVKLKCPNKSARHTDYKISVYNIQESNCVCCPKCSIKTSKAEMRIYSELKYAFKDVRWQQKIEGREADIILEDLKLVIEVDGFPWHMDKIEKDLIKNSIFEKNGYFILRIRDTKLREIACNSLICDLSDLQLTDYNRIVEWINIHFKCNIEVYTEWKNIEYYKKIQASLLSVPYNESVEYLFPESKDIWDYEKNHPFIPSQFTKGSHMEMWIKCKNNHSYKRPIKQIFRIINSIHKILKCPECYKSKINKIVV